MKSQGGRSKRRHRPLYSHEGLATAAPGPEVTSSRDNETYQQTQQTQKKNVAGIQTSASQQQQQQGTESMMSSSAATAAGPRPRGHQRNSVHFDAKVIKTCKSKR